MPTQGRADCREGCASSLGRVGVLTGRSGKSEIMKGSQDSGWMVEEKAVLAEGAVCTQLEEPRPRSGGWQRRVWDTGTRGRAGSPQGGQPFSGRR